MPTRRTPIGTISVYLAESTRTILDEDADVYGMTRSAYISMLIVQARMQRLGAKLIESLDAETLGKYLKVEDSLT